MDNDNKALFDAMHGELLKGPSLFWGYGFHDGGVSRKISDVLENGHQDIWVQCMPGDEKNIDYFRDIGCHVIIGTTEDLLSWIKVNFQTAPASSSSEIDMSSIQKYLIPTVNQLAVVTQDDFFVNGHTDWSCILLDYAYETESVNLLYEMTLKNKNVIGVGIPFSGKTTVMMQLVAKALASTKLNLTGITIEEAKRIINLLQRVDVLAVMDNCCDDVKVIRLLMEQPNFKILGFADDYAFESSRHLLSGVSFACPRFGELSLADARGIYNKIPQHLRRGKFEYKGSEDEKWSTLEFMSANVMNILTKKRIRDLLKRILDTSEQSFQIIALSAYLTCNNSILNMDVLCSFFDTTDYNLLREYLAATQGYLREVDVSLTPGADDQDYYSLRSNLFARLAFSELSTHFVAAFSNVIRKFISCVYPCSIYRFDIFKRSAYDGRFFAELFKETADDLYDIIYRFENSPYTLQQWALYKAFCKEYEDAFSKIQKALAQKRNNFSIQNSHAIILFEANRGKQTPAAQEGMAEAMETLRKCFSNDLRKTYHAQKFSDFAIYLAENWGNDEYLSDAKKWLEQLINSGESTSNRTKDLLKRINRLLILE